jgi:hypothetical protein
LLIQHSIGASSIGVGLAITVMTFSRSKIRVARGAREGDHVADVFKPREIHHDALESDRL